MKVSITTDTPQSVTERAAEAVQVACDESLLKKGLTVAIVEDDSVVNPYLDGSKEILDRLPPRHQPTHRTLRIR